MGLAEAEEEDAGSAERSADDDAGEATGAGDGEAEGERKVAS